MTRSLSTPQSRKVFHEHHLMAFLDETTLDKLAERYNTEALQKRRSRKQAVWPTCASCGDSPCTCGKEIYIR